MSIQYTQDELLTFQYFFTICDQTGQGILVQDVVINFFKASGLNQQTLGAIWQITSSNGQTFTKDEFFAALKLIALAQNGYSPDEKLLSKNITCSLPQFQGLQPPNYEISLEQLQKYENYFLTIDQEGTQIVQGMQARALFSKSGLSLDQLKELWNLCDIGEKGYLNKGEFIVALHLVQLCSKFKFPLPITLSDSLLQITNKLSINPNRSRLGSNQNLIPQQRFGSNSNLLNQPRPRLGSNANIGIQPIQNFQQIQQVNQPLNIPTNVNMIPGYDQNGINQVRQQVNDSTQQVYQMQTQLNQLYQSIIFEKQEDVKQMQVLNDNLRLIFSNLQEQYKVINEELNKIRIQKQGLTQQNQQLQQQIGIQLQQNKEQFTQLQQEQQQEQQYLQLPYQNFQAMTQNQQLSQPSHQQNFGFQNTINYGNNSPLHQTNQIKIQPQQPINQFNVDEIQKQTGLSKIPVETQRKQVTFVQHQEQFPW
ncbi:unnamed protein product [Paramecium pentaurelia]|uniref:Uncharacterized protein n=1 Tax=Paramecium pentaurelia TaxID=43138 RepID=A0A8S1XF54_9CILI|nr:unnamed protein product [Paramecium pentaurelia]